MILSITGFSLVNTVTAFGQETSPLIECAAIGLEYNTAQPENSQQNIKKALQDSRTLLNALLIQEHNCALSRSIEPKPFTYEPTWEESLEHLIPYIGPQLKALRGERSWMEYLDSSESKVSYWPSIEHLRQWKIVSAHTPPENLGHCWGPVPYLSEAFRERYDFSTSSPNSTEQQRVHEDFLIFAHCTQ